MAPRGLPPEVKQRLEKALATNPARRRPKPDIDALRVARPELKSVVKHPPQAAASASTGDGMTAV